ncbi:DUF421 domain-containing protein [Tsuneonella sp. HG222]
MDIVLRATVMFAIVYLLLRLLGKRELGELAPFELVSLVVIGDLIQQGITHNDFSLTGAALAIGTFAFWTLALGWVTFLFPKTERWLEGEPRVIVSNGRMLTANMRRERISQNELFSEMRLAGIARVRDVAWAILEPNGKISFIAAGDERSDQSDTQEGG